MKKIISLILTVAMLFSMTTLVAPVSAETEVNDLFMAEPTREEFLNNKNPEYIDLKLFQDVFATQTEKESSFWGAWDGSNKITDVYAFKGYNTEQEFIYPANTSSTSKKNLCAFLIESTNDDYTTLENNDKVMYDENLGRYVVTAGNVKYKLGEIAEGKKGGNFIVFGSKYDVKTYEIADGLGIKEQELDTNMYPNAGTEKQITTALIPVNKANITEVNFLLTASNTSSSVFMPVTITYTDKTEDYMWIYVGNISKDFQDYIVAANPTDETYATIDKNAKIAKDVLGKKVENEDIVFPITGKEMYNGSKKICDKFYIPNESFKLATFYKNQGTIFGGYAHSFSIPVDKSKTVERVKFEKIGVNITTGYYKDAGAYCNNESSADAAAYIPITIKNADSNYKYYIKTIRACGRAGMFAMSTTSESLKSKINALEARINALDETYNSAQKIEIAEIKNAIQSLEGEGVLESDYDAELIAKFDTLYQSAEAEIKAAQIASVEGKITNMAFKYTSSMRAEVEEIKAEYDALIASGISASEFNSDLMSKFSKVYDVYVMSSGLEDKAESWGTEYLYELYDEVVAAKALADGLKENEAADKDNVIAKATADKINKFAGLAIDGLAIDTAIDGLDSVYNKAQLDAIVEIKKSIDEFKNADGTDKGLANAEIFNKLYEDAGPDLLQRDIDEVVARINALGEIYTATADAEMASIEAAINAIKSKGGVIPTDAAEKLASLVAQREEEPAYTPFDLPYNKDVMESLVRYLAQYKDANGNYVKDSETGRFVIQNPAKEWTFAAFLNSTLTCDEDTFVEKLGINLETNKATIHGVPYQFGKIKTTVDGVIDAENNVISSAVASKVVIDVPNNSYAKIHSAMWARNDQGKFAVTYKYADGTTSTEENVTTIAGGTSLSSFIKDPYYKAMTNDGKASIKLYRAYSPQYDTSAPCGGYVFAVTDHILTPNDKKILDKIEFTFSTTDAHIFAMTGQISNSVLLNKVLTEAVNGIDTTAEENIRAVLEGCSNLMAALDEKEVAYDETFAATVAENKNIFVAIESIKAYTDLDNLTYTVKFTGPVAESSLTKALFAIKEIVKNDEGEDVTIAFNDYEIVPVVENGEIREVKLIIKNNFEYDRRFTLTVDKTVAGVSGKTIFTEAVAEYDAKPAVDTDFKLEENGTGSVKIVNNMNDAQEVTAIVAVYNEKNQMVAKYLVNRVLATGESVAQPVTFQLSEGQKVECLVLDSLTNCKKVYNTFIVE